MDEIEDQDLINYIQNMEKNVQGILASTENQQDTAPSMESAMQFISDQQKTNTTKATNRDIRTLTDWLATKKFELREIETIPPVELNQLLTQFFVFIRRRDEGEYQPSSLTSMMYSIDRHLRQEKYSFEDKHVNIMKDVEFTDTRNALKSKRVQLKSLGKGDRPNRSVGVDEEEEELLWKKGVLGLKNSFSIQFTLWYFLTLLMGLRGRDEHRSIKFGDLVLAKNGLGVEFLHLKERVSKTRDGACADDNRPTQQKIFCSCATQGVDRCVIEIYKEFVRRRPVNYCEPDHPFYVQSKTEEQITRSGTEIWYKREPYGVASLGKFLPKACTLAGLPPRGNHGVRATTVQRLRKAKVPDDKIIQITGHKSVRTLAVYDQDQLRPAEHQSIQSILQRELSSPPSIPQPAASSPCVVVPPVSNELTSSMTAATQQKTTETQSLSVNTNTVQTNNQCFQQAPQNMASSLFGGAIISNCTFNINPIFYNHASHT